MIAAALSSGAASMSYTYSEPTIFFELMTETAELALKANLKNILVSNGFQSPQCLDALHHLIQAANIDLKSMRDDFYRDFCGARLRPVLENLVRMRKMGRHLEVTTLVIPGLNDTDDELTDIARFIRTELGEETPWHVSRFHPAYRLNHLPPTPPETLLRAVDIGRSEGLFFVFAGNMRSNRQNTVCPCGAVVVEREGFTVLRSTLVRGACPQCGRKIIAGC
jgi:pyruvate formate lyase activating enzyme